MAVEYFIQKWLWKRLLLKCEVHPLLTQCTINYCFMDTDEFVHILGIGRILICTPHSPELSSYTHLVLDSWGHFHIFLIFYAGHANLLCNAPFLVYLQTGIPVCFVKKIMDESHHDVKLCWRALALWSFHSSISGDHTLLIPPLNNLR